MAEFLEKINYESLNNIAYDKIVEALRSGEFEPGATLRTRTLAKALGVSSTPVREALSKLIAQNALEVDPRNRTAIVPTLTRELLEEMYSIREVLDGMAAEEAAKKINALEIQKLEDLARELDDFEKAGAGESSECLDKSEEFFMSVFRASRRPILFQLLDSLWLRSGVILGLLSKRRPHDFTISKHRWALVQGLKEHDPKKAKKAMDQLLRETKEMVFACMDAEEARQA